MESTSEAVASDSIAALYRRVRAFTEQLTEPLEPGDLEPQSMPDCSPVKWHLAHTTWFFETFVLEQFEPAFCEYHPKFRYLFNSYYNAVGERQPRPERGLLTRPTAPVIAAYRRSVDERLLALLDRLEQYSSQQATEIVRVVEIGCHHEQQHQELILTDLKHLFSRNVLRPSYIGRLNTPNASVRPLGWRVHEAGLYEIGHSGRSFAYDNETPRHRVFLESFALADRLVTNGEYAEFIADGGYQRPELWLDMGFATAQDQGWRCPLYWGGGPGEYTEYSLQGERELNLAEPVCHVSLYEADAFARWAGARLAREQEWEVATHYSTPVAGNFVESGLLHPTAAPTAGGLQQCFGDCWEWTQSAYSPYPGYQPAVGALGEYNGKFMINQSVLRGGSCATAQSHIRPTYRNFFYAKDRWQFSGIRLAKDSNVAS